MLKRYIPGHFRDPFGLAVRIFRSGSREARFAAFTAALGVAAAPLDMLLRRREQKLYDSATAPQRPVLLVCGAPRSGTTVCSQILIHHLPVAYLTNLTAVFPRSPIMAQRLFRLDLRNEAVTPRSFYGKTRHWWGPNDALYLWDRWLGKDRTRAPESLSAEARDRMRRFFATVETAAGRPVLNKNNSLDHSAHLVAEALETAHFLCVVREPLFLAQSLYQARFDIHGSEDESYGVRPPVADESLDPLEEVARQALYHQQLAELQRSRVGPGRFHILSYDDVCADPAEIVRWVGADILEEGTDPVDLDSLAPLKPSRTRKIPAAQFDRLEEIIERLSQTGSSNRASRRSGPVRS
jgi:hypothetical protein